MASLPRYRSDTIRGNKRLGTAQAVQSLRRATAMGQIAFDEYILKENERLDQIAHKRYGDGRLWWIIAATSNIGWALQVPPGTLLKIPINISDVKKFV